MHSQYRFRYPLFIKLVGPFPGFHLHDDILVGLSGRFAQVFRHLPSNFKYASNEYRMNANLEDILTIFIEPIRPINYLHSVSGSEAEMGILGS